VTSNGARVHYKVIGRGRPTIAFLHGLGGDMNVWREQVGPLQAKARLILIDLPGHGGSEAPATYSIRELARAVNVVLIRTNAERVILVGQGVGAIVARDVDRYYPGHCRAIVSVDGMLRKPDASAESHNPFDEAVMAPEVWKDDKVSLPLYVLIPRDAHADEAYLGYVRGLGNDVTVDVVESAGRLFMLDDPSAFNARLEKWLVAHRWLK
jgi:pimeloyl-ACP methyl ester carboxylesterase